MACVLINSGLDSVTLGADAAPSSSLAFVIMVVLSSYTNDAAIYGVSRQQFPLC
jgi:hypothetical protein